MPTSQLVDPENRLQKLKRAAEKEGLKLQGEWRATVKQRKGGATAGQNDVTYHAPWKESFRSLCGAMKAIKARSGQDPSSAPRAVNQAGSSSVPPSMKSKTPKVQGHTSGKGGRKTSEPCTLTVSSSYAEFVRWLRRCESMKDYCDDILDKLKENGEKPCGRMLLGANTETLREKLGLSFSEASMLHIAIREGTDGGKKLQVRQDAPAPVTLTNGTAVAASATLPLRDAPRWNENQIKADALARRMITRNPCVKEPANPRPMTLGNICLPFARSEAREHAEVGVQGMLENLEVQDEKEQGGKTKVAINGKVIFVLGKAGMRYPWLHSIDSHCLPGSGSSQAPLIHAARRTQVLTSVQDLLRRSPSPIAVGYELRLREGFVDAKGELVEGWWELVLEVSITGAGLYTGFDPDPARRPKDEQMKVLLQALYLPSFQLEPGTGGKDALTAVYERHRELQDLPEAIPWPQTLSQLEKYDFQLQGVAFLREIEQGQRPIPDPMWLPVSKQSHLHYNPEFGLVTEQRFFRLAPSGSISADAAGLGKTVLEVMLLEILLEDDKAGPRLYVVPSNLEDQWPDAFQQYSCKRLRWVLYQGMSRNGKIKIQQGDKVHKLSCEVLRSSHAVFVTWEVFKKELNFVREDRKGSRSSRTPAGGKRSLRSPLQDVIWQCLVMDESEAINGGNNNAHRMASRLQALHRRCISGTPFTRLEDIRHVMQVLYARGCSDEEENEEEQDPNDMVQAGNGIFIYEGKHLTYINRAIQLARNPETQAWGVEVLARLLARVMMRRLWDVAPELPPQLHRVQRIPVTKASRVYTNLLRWFGGQALGSILGGAALEGTANNSKLVNSIFSRVMGAATHPQHRGREASADMHTVGFFPDWIIHDASRDNIVLSQRAILAGMVDAADIEVARCLLQTVKALKRMAEVQCASSAAPSGSAEAAGWKAPIQHALRLLKEYQPPAIRQRPRPPSGIEIFNDDSNAKLQYNKYIAELDALAKDLTGTLSGVSQGPKGKKSGSRASHRVVSGGGEGGEDQDLVLRDLKAGMILDKNSAHLHLHQEDALRKVQEVRSLLSLTRLEADVNLLREEYCGKLAWLLGELEKDLRSKTQALVACGSMNIYIMLTYILHERGVTHQHLDMQAWCNKAGRLSLKDRSVQEKLAIIRSFLMGDITILVLKACDDKEVKGLNLQAAKKVYMVEPILEQARRHQLLHRSHRLGKRSPSEVIYLLSEGSLEEQAYKKYIEPLDGNRTAFGVMKDIAERPPRSAGMVWGLPAGEAATLLGDVVTDTFCP